MGLTYDILDTLFSYPDQYREVWRRAYGHPDVRRHERSVASAWSDGRVRVTLARLKKRGLAEKKGKVWRITKLGREYLHRVRDAMHWPAHSKATRATRVSKNMVVIFDIPEKEKRKRDWLRAELRLIGFTMLQESAWLGPAPVPENFTKSVQELHLLPHLKFFEAKEKDIV